MGLFSGELIFGGTYFWRELCASKWIGLGNKTTEGLNIEKRFGGGGLFSGGLTLEHPASRASLNSSKKEQKERLCRNRH